MRHETIRKRPGDLRVAPNLVVHESARATFTGDDARRELSGLPGGGLNIAYECVDRHAAGPRRDHLALRGLGRHGERHDLTYGDLEDLTNRFANVLSGLGVARGEHVFVLAGRIPELYVSVLGALKHGALARTLFSAFGPEPIRQRLDIGDGRVLVTKEAFYRRKVESIRDRLPQLGHVVLIGERDQRTLPNRTHDFHELLDAASGRYKIEPTDPDDIALLHFTRPRRCRRALRDREARTRPPQRRRVLVHR